MTNKPIHVKPSLYAFYYESLKIIAKDYGYNLVLHGSMNRDLDLIAIPWVDNTKDEFEMIQEFDKYLTGFCSSDKEHYMFGLLPAGRRGYVINLNRGGEWNKHVDVQYYIDISVIPTQNKL